MDSSRLGELRAAAKKVFKKASRPGGALEKGKFTMHLARLDISRAMGLGDDGLDDIEWKRAVKAEINELLEQGGSDHEAGPSSPVRRTPASARKAITKRKGSPEPAVTTDSEAGSNGSGDEPEANAMSSVYDVPPPGRKRKAETTHKRKRSKKARSDDESAKSSNTKRGKTKVVDDLTPDEAKVADLKRMVVACGVRKQWTKEFADMPTAKAQIRQLQSLLVSLGMKGQPTVGKAKKIKESRELAAELDDVRQFEAERGVSSGRRSRRSKPTASGKWEPKDEKDDDVEDDDEADDDDGEDQGRRHSIMDDIKDLLADQSDSDYE